MRGTRSRFGVIIVPRTNGMLILESPSPCAPDITVVSTTVPTKPQSGTPPYSSCGRDVARPKTRARASSVAPPGRREGQRRVDQADMGEGLREVPERRARRLVDLLGEQPQVVAEGTEVSKRGLRAVHIALARATVASTSSVARSIARRARSLSSSAVSVPLV